MSKITKTIVSLVLIVVIGVGTIIGNWAVEQFEGEITSFLSPAIVDTESMEISSAQGQAMAAQIMEEGAILLQNNDNTLPLDYSKVKKVNVFGWRSVDWIYGSEGANASGGVSPEDGDFSKNVDLFKALKQYGIQYNDRLEKMYYTYVQPDHQSADLKGQHINNLINLREPNINDKAYYSDDLLSYCESYSDTAIVVIGRMAGENMDITTNKQNKEGPGSSTDNTRHYLEISTEEEALLKYVGQTYENVIVILNTSNAFECGFLETIPGIDACLYVGYTGTRAASAIPKLLYGEVSPSGHTADTFAYDAFTNPANIWAVRFSKYTDFSRSYNDFIENIYVGYKWYETADAEGYWNEYSNQFGTGFDAVVQFPFGFGLSYNTYSWEVGEIYTTTLEDETPVPYVNGGTNEITHMNSIHIPVTVTNEGQYPGRDVVQAYVTVPYTKGGIEKTALQLVGYAKTNLLQPGESETIIVTMDVNDFTSYDCYDKNNNGHKGWELEAGQYVVSLRSDSHTVKTVLDSGNPAINNFDVSETIKITHDKYTNQPVGNLFTGEDAVDEIPIDGKTADYDPQIPWLTRADFMTLEEISAARKARAVTPGANINALSDINYAMSWAEKWDNATVDEFGDPVVNTPVVWGVDHGLRVAENGVITDLGRKLGADYDAEEWDLLLEQVTMAEVQALVSKYYGSKAIASVGKPFLTDLDGPAQIKGFSTAPRGTGYPAMVILASCFNQTLAYKFGQSFGDDMKSVGVMGLWGWAIDNHRSMFFSRNHESPSEDCILASYTIMNAVNGLHTRGRYCTLKHFAIYDCGANSPKDTSYWLTEQSLRENQLRGYYKPIVLAGALGVMTAYRGPGAAVAESTVGMITGILRREWQFKGAITTDYTGTETGAHSELIVRAGGDLGMGNKLTPNGWTYDSTASLRFQNRMKQVVKDVLYMWLHADYLEQQYLANPDASDVFLSSTSIQSWEWWRPALQGINVFAISGLSVWTLCVVLDLCDPTKDW